MIGLMKSSFAMRAFSMSLVYVDDSDTSAPRSGGLSGAGLISACRCCPMLSEPDVDATTNRSTRMPSSPRGP